jgi:hypothetical protein
MARSRLQFALFDIVPFAFETAASLGGAAVRSEDGKEGGNGFISTDLSTQKASVKRSSLAVGKQRHPTLLPVVRGKSHL